MTIAAEDMLDVGFVPRAIVPNGDDSYLATDGVAIYPLARDSILSPNDFQKLINETAERGVSQAILDLTNRVDDLTDDQRVEVTALLISGGYDVFYERWKWFHLVAGHGWIGAVDERYLRPLGALDQYDVFQAEKTTPMYFRHRETLAVSVIMPIGWLDESEITPILRQNVLALANAIRDAEGR